MLSCACLLDRKTQRRFEVGRWSTNVPCRLRQILLQKVNVLHQWFNRELKDPLWLLSRQFFRVSDEGLGFDSSRSWVTHRCVRRVLLIPSASYANPYLLREKTADQVVSGLKLKLKTSPTKVRLVSLKKSWKQAGRSHERRDVDFAESADFAEFDLRNRTQLNGHSNTYKRGFPLACSMPNCNDVRLKRNAKKKVPNIEKNRHHIGPRGQGVKGAKFQCQSRERSGPKFPSVHRCHGKHGEHRKTVQVIRWSSRKRRVVQAPAEPATGEMIFPDPRFPQKSPQMGKGNFFLHCHKKCQFCFTQEIKGNLNFAPKVFQTTKTNW